jgi:hypothetical protein
MFFPRNWDREIVSPWYDGSSKSGMGYPILAACLMSGRCAPSTPGIAATRHMAVTHICFLVLPLMVVSFPLGVLSIHADTGGASAALTYLPALSRMLSIEAMVR